MLLSSKAFKDVHHLLKLSLFKVYIYASRTELSLSFQPLFLLSLSPLFFTTNDYYITEGPLYKLQICLNYIEEQNIPVFVACANKGETVGDSGEADTENKQENPHDRVEQYLGRRTLTWNWVTGIQWKKGLHLIYIFKYSAGCSIRKLLEQKLSIPSGKMSGSIRLWAHLGRTWASSFISNSQKIQTLGTTH